MTRQRIKKSVVATPPPVTSKDAVSVSASNDTNRNKSKFRRNQEVSSNPAAIAQRRENLQKEINANCVKPISFEIYKKTLEEKVALKNAKSAYKTYLSTINY